MTATFPTTECRKADWRPLIMAAMTWLSDVGDGDVKFNEIIDYIGGLDGFPGWATWGDYNGKPNQMGRRYVSLEATALKKEGVLTSPRRGTYRLASDEAPEATVLHKAVLTVVPDPEPEVEAPEAPTPVVAAVVDGPVTHSLYLANERARRIAVEQTRCFGFYSERAKACGDCPLAGLCFAARGANVAEANARAEDARIKAEEAAREASLAATVVNALGDTSEAPVEAPAEAPEAPEAPAPTAGKVVTLPWAVVCSGCGGETEAGGEVIAVDGVGTYHKGCAPSAALLLRKSV